MQRKPSRRLNHSVYYCSFSHPNQEGHTENCLLCAIEVFRVVFRFTHRVTSAKNPRKKIPAPGAGLEIVLRIKSSSLEIREERKAAFAQYIPKVDQYGLWVKSDLPSNSYDATIIFDDILGGKLDIYDRLQRYCAILKLPMPTHMFVRHTYDVRVKVDGQTKWIDEGKWILDQVKNS